MYEEVARMVLESQKGRLIRSDNRIYIYVPSEISRDSAFPFPFKKGYVKIRIDPEKKRLVVEKLEE